MTFFGPSTAQTSASGRAEIDVSLFEYKKFQVSFQEATGTGTISLKVISSIGDTEEEVRTISVASPKSVTIEGELDTIIAESDNSGDSFILLVGGL